MTPISEIIRRRYSCRSYSDRPVDDDIAQALGKLAAASHQGPFGNKPRFKLIAMDALPREEWKKLGTYGVIKNAHLYLAGMMSPAPMATFDYGYCKEKLILEVTKMGLNTCWLGGTFAISAFGRAAGMRLNELLPTITPVGYAAQRRSLTERVMRSFAGSDHRLPWEKLFFRDHGATPLTPDEASVYQEALENVRQGPSASNKQPWRIICVPDRKVFLFYLARTAGYRHLRDFSLQEIDLGIAICHFDLTVKELGFKGNWRLEDEAPKEKTWEYVASWQEEG